MSTYMQLDKHGQITIRNDDLQVKSLMLLIACIDNSLKGNDSVEIEGGNYLVVGIGDTTATAKMPVLLSAMVIVLGDNSPSIKTENSTSAALDENGVAWN